MLSKEIIRVAKEIIAAKWSNRLKPVYETLLLKNYNVKTYEELNEAQIDELNGKINSIMEKVEEKIQEIASYFTDKPDDVVTLKWIVSIIDSNKLYNFMNNENFLEIKNSCENYKEFSKFLDKDKQQYTNYKDFASLNNVVLPYINEYKENEKSIDGFEKVGQSGEYTILKLTDYHASLKLFNKQSITWCVKAKSFWDQYRPPYYLVLVKYQPYYLINFNSNQFSDQSQGKKAPIDEKLGNLIYDLIKKENGGACVFTKPGMQSKNWDVMYPYYPISQIIKTNDSQIIKDCIKQSFVSNDNKRYADLVKELKEKNIKFDGDDLIDAISDEKQFVKATDSEISNGITMNKKNVIKLMFNAFKRGNSGKSLFKKMLRYSPSETNPELYTEGNNEFANINEKDESNKSLLSYCSTKSQIILLIDCHIDIKESDYDKIFKNAIKESNVETIKYLISDGKAKISERTIVEAMYSRHRSIIKMFLDSGLDFNEPMYNHVTPLIYSIYNRMYAVMEDLIKSGKIDLEKEIDGHNAVEACLDQNNDEALEMLINAGAFVKNPFKSGKLSGKTLVQVCIERQNKKVLEAALKQSADVNTGYPLHTCIKNGSNDFAKAIIASPSVDFTLQDEDGNTPMMVAIIAKNRELVFDIYSKSHKGLGIANKSGFTPLMLFIEHDFSADDVIKIFKNPNKTVGGEKIDFKSALDIAYDKVQNNNIKKIIDFLNEANNIRPKNKQFDSSNQMYNFVISGNLTGLKGLVEGDQKNTIDFLTDKNGANILHICVQAKYLDILEYLVDYLSSLDKNILNKLKEQKFRGMTPIEMIDKALSRIRPDDHRSAFEFNKMKEIFGARTIMSKIINALSGFIK